MSFKVDLDEGVEPFEPIIHSEVKAAIGWVMLNRPRALNALNLEMIRHLHQQLLSWRDDPQVHCVVIQSAHGKAFCSGGDLRSVYEARERKNNHFLETLFKEEYTLNHFIKTYPKPYIAFINGIAMGGGLGISVNGSHCVVTEKAVLAMPEVGIGYFPDVGASCFLNQTPGSLGLYLGLTGKTFNTADAVYSGIAPYYIPSDQLPLAVAALMEASSKSFESLNKVLMSFKTQELPMVSELQTKRELIDRCFSKATLEEILNSLREESDPFARDILSLILSRSPTSLYVTLGQLQRAKRWDFKKVMQSEYALSQVFLKGHDFFEGIRAAIIDKDRRPQWNPRQLESVDKKEIETYFAAEDGGKLLQES
jgi:enoyl-CoA hydratase/carnithine racemase